MPKGQGFFPSIERIFRASLQFLRDVKWFKPRIKRGIFFSFLKKEKRKRKKDNSPKAVKCHEDGSILSKQPNFYQYLVHTNSTRLSTVAD